MKSLNKDERKAEEEELNYEEEPFDYEGEADYLRKKEKEDKIVKQMETKLKTLKDIEIERAKICNGCNKDCNGYKFKTCGWNYNKLGELSRQEAIKWIKEKYTWKTTMDDEDTFEIEVMRRLKNDWMEFFNITEENLK